MTNGGGVVSRLVTMVRYGLNNGFKVGAIDRWAWWEDAFAGFASGRADFRNQTYLPSKPPPSGAYAGSMGSDPDLGFALDMRDTQNTEAVRVRPPYGVPYYATNLYPYTKLQAASPVGYGQPLVDPSDDYYGGDYPLALQPTVNAPPPWEQAGGLYG